MAPPQHQIDVHYMMRPDRALKSAHGVVFQIQHCLRPCTLARWRTAACLGVLLPTVDQRRKCETIGRSVYRVTRVNTCARKKWGPAHRKKKLHSTTRGQTLHMEPLIIFPTVGVFTLIDVVAENEETLEYFFNFLNVVINNPRRHQKLVGENCWPDLVRFFEELHIGWWLGA